MALRSLRRHLASNRLLLVLGVVYVASQATIAWILRDLGLGQVLEAQTTFSKATFLALVHDWEAARLLPRYREHFLFDFLHPLWYGLLLAGLLAKGLDRSGAAERWNGLLLVPLLAGLMDLAENAFHLRFIADLEAVTQTQVTLSALAANLKWALVAASLALILSLRPWRAAATPRLG